MSMRSYAALIVLLLAAWFTRLQNLAQLATQADEGVHITVAEQVAFHQQQIYGDLFENRTPGVEWLLAGWFRLAGADVYTSRVPAVAVTIMTGALLFALAGRAARRAAESAGYGADAKQGAERGSSIRAGLFATVLFLLAPLSIFWSRFVMLEHFSTAAATASIAAALVAWEKRSGKAWVVSGALAGLAVLFKQTELVLLGGMIVFFGAQLLSRSRHDIRASALQWSGGLALAIVPALLFFAVQGTLAPFLTFVLGAGQLAPLSNLAVKAAEIVFWSIRRPYPWLLLPAAAFALWRGQARHRLLLIWFLAEAGLLFLPPELDLERGGFSHYSLPVLASASVLASAGMVGLWRALSGNHPARFVVFAPIVLAILLVTPAWLGDTVEAITSTEYPQATVAQEMAAGDGAAMLAPPGTPIQVLGNAIFYHHARRVPAGRFFHWPDYLAQSDLAPEAVAAVTASLTMPGTGAVVVSRLHLQDRLPAQLQSTLWQNWTPVAIFPYPYQRDVLLFTPRRQTTQNSASQATFDERIDLLEIEAQWLDGQTVLVRLHWQAQTAPETDYTVFVHVLGEEGKLLAQDDAVPVVGFRPTSTWQAGEAVLDYHWIRLPELLTAGDLQLSVGLYESSSGLRLPVTSGAGEGDSYRRPLQAAQ